MTVAAKPARKSAAKPVSKKAAPARKTTTPARKNTVRQAAPAKKSVGRAKKSPATVAKKTPATPAKKTASPAGKRAAAPVAETPVKPTRAPRRMKPLLELARRPDGRALSFTERVEERMHKQLGHKGPICHLCRTNASRLALASA